MLLAFTILRMKVANKPLRWRGGAKLYFMADNQRRAPISACYGGYMGLLRRKPRQLENLWLSFCCRPERGPIQPRHILTMTCRPERGPNRPELIPTLLLLRPTRHCYGTALKGATPGFPSHLKAPSLPLTSTTASLPPIPGVSGDDLPGALSNNDLLTSTVSYWPPGESGHKSETHRG